MRRRIAGYRRDRDDGRDDPEIGCIMLRVVRFFDPDDAPAAAPGWAPNIVQGRGYDLADSEGSYLEHVLELLLRTHLTAEGARPGQVDGPVFGEPRPAVPRLARGHRVHGILTVAAG